MVWPGLVKEYARAQRGRRDRSVGIEERIKTGEREISRAHGRSDISNRSSRYGALVELRVQAFGFNPLIAITLRVKTLGSVSLYLPVVISGLSCLI